MGQKRMAEDNSILGWLIPSLEKYIQGEFEGSEEEAHLWSIMSSVEAKIECDPVRAVKIKYHGEDDIFCITYSYFSVAVLGLFSCLRDLILRSILGEEGIAILEGHEDSPERKTMLLIAQEESPEESDILRAEEVFTGSLEDLVTRMGEYSKVFDEKTRERLENG